MVLRWSGDARVGEGVRTGGDGEGVRTNGGVRTGGGVRGRKVDCRRECTGTGALLGLGLITTCR